MTRSAADLASDLGGQLLYHAKLTEVIQYSGCKLMFVGGKELKEVPGLAIIDNVQGRHKNELMLIYCDEDWSLIGLAPYESTEQAMQRAERMYPGVNSLWVKAN